MRRVPVTVLGYGTYVDHLDFRCIRLGQNSLDHILRRSHVDLQGLFRIIIGSRRNHTSDMEDIVRSGNAGEDVLISHEVTPDNSYRGIRKIWLKHLAVLSAVACKYPYIETFLSGI